MKAPDFALKHYGQIGEASKCTSLADDVACVDLLLFAREVGMFLLLKTQVPSYSIFH